MFLYFYPGKLTAEVSEQIKRHIGYAIDGGKTERKRELQHGPAGEPAGYLFADQSFDADRFKLDIENQYWRRIPNTPAWVGMYRGDKLEPSLLQRSEMVDGVAVHLADDTIWQVAYARRFVELDGGNINVYCPLPRTLELQDDGQWTPTKIAPRFRRLAEIAERYNTAANNACIESDGKAETVRFEFLEIDELAVAGLQANYRIGAAELAFFDCYDIQARQRIVSAIMDDATLRAWTQKKTDAAGVGSNS